MKVTKINGIEPRIIFKLPAYMKMKKIIDEVNNECAWHGIVTHVGNIYWIDDIEIYPQIVTSTTVEADEEKYPLWVLEHTDEVINYMRFQGHSHVNMGVTPSGTDIDFYNKLTEQVKDFYIFIIQNKKGEYNLRLVDKENGLLYEDLKYEIDYGVTGIDEWYTEAHKQIQSYRSVHVVSKGKLDPLVKTAQKSANGVTTNGTTTTDSTSHGKETTIPDLETEELELMYAIEESALTCMRYCYNYNNDKVRRLYEKACKQHEKFLGIVEGWHMHKLDGDKDRAIIAYNKLVDISVELEQLLEKEGIL